MAAKKATEKTGEILKSDCLTLTFKCALGGKEVTLPAFSLFYLYSNITDNISALAQRISSLE